MSAPQSEAFQKAIVDSKKLLSKPSANDLLKLYGYYKVGLGEDIEKATAPSFYDLKGKSKYNAWSKVVKEEQLTPDQAQEKYVAVVEGFKEEYGYDANKEPESVG